MNDQFSRGYACAVATIIKSHGESTATREALEAAGLTTLRALQHAMVEEYDIAVLEPTIHEIAARKKRRKL